MNSSERLEEWETIPAFFFVFFFGITPGKSLLVI